MRITRLHCSQHLAEKEDISLSQEQAHHLINVLRHSSGDKVHVYNETDGEFEGSLTVAKKSKATVSINSHLRSFKAPEFSIHLYLGVSRGDRMDFGIQKSVEMGVVSITPLFSEYGESKLKQWERLEKKTRHWQRIAESASEQSGRLDVPTINSPAEFLTCIAKDSTIPTLIMDGSGSGSLSDVELNDAVNVFIGPEGGFSSTELEKAAEIDCQVINLGPRTLRTETAPITALAILQHRFGDL